MAFVTVMADVLFPLAQVSAERTRSACGEDPGFFCREVFEWTEDRTLAEFADFFLGKPLTILVILIGALIVNRLARRAIKNTLRGLNSGPMQERMGSLRRRTPSALLETQVTSLRAEQRITALTSVLRSMVSFVIFLIAGFMCMAEIGIELGPLIAGAGILGVALGFGSQSLVKDFLSGMFILIEDQFGVGDIVNLDEETQGTVEAVSLRTTRLRSLDGTVWHVPNGEIRRVGNQSQLWSRALLDLEVAYDTDVEHAKAIIKRTADEAWKERADILDEPEVWGVESLGPNSVIIRLVVKTKPSEQFMVSRSLRERIKRAFDAEGIEIPFPQQMVWHRDVPKPAAAEDGRGTDA